MQAVIRTGGKQYIVESGSVIDVELLGQGVGESVTFDDVLMVGDGSTVRIGKPQLKDVTVLAEVIALPRGQKLDVFKKIRRQGKQLKKGHRQNLARVKITEIK